MKNSLAIVILATMLSCCGRAGQSLLEKAEESPDKLARLEAVEYYKERGTANERMKAHYLLGYVYRDLHWQHSIGYLFLQGEESIAKNYRTGGAAPYFLLLDERRIVRRVFFGFSKDDSPALIRSAIKEILDVRRTYWKVAEKSPENFPIP